MRGLFDRISSPFRSRRAAAPDLPVRVNAFREVLHANNTALGVLAEIQEALEGEHALSGAEVRRLVTSITVQTYRMIANLETMTGAPSGILRERFEQLRHRIARSVEVTPYLQPIGPVVPLERVGAAMAEVVGRKSAFLGEARKLLGGEVPNGFATTVEAYRRFMRVADLGRRIAETVAALDPSDVAASFRASARITQWIESAPLPSALAEAIEGAVRAAPVGTRPRFAVRSSALEEGGFELSFAGQYRSLLNVPPEDVADAFRCVVAGKYSPQAIAYRLGRGFDDEEIAMCCCVIEMIDAAAAGVLYTADPDEEGGATLVQAVRGLGISAVDGSAASDSYRIDRGARRIVERRQGFQKTAVLCAPDVGTVRVPAAEDGHRGLVLSDDQVIAVAERAWRIEDAMGMPIDVEWAINLNGSPFILQVRPQQGAAVLAGAPAARVASARVLVEGGSRASRGAGAGNVHRVETDLDILTCEPGSVIVTAEANPRFAVLLPKAAALVADLGEITGHLATVARELHVPALVATREATGILTEGALVTVDADARLVYEGRVEEALARPTARPRAEGRDAHRERLRAVSAHVVPLTVRDRLASGFSPRRCRTLHDLIRYCHQATVEAMFDLGDETVRGGREVHRLVSDVPFELRLIDLGGGLRPGVAAREITMEDVASVPMRALWQGMTDPRLQWRKTRPVSLRGFMSAVVNYNVDQDSRMRGMGEPSYAFVTRDYLNLNSRIGYHFSTVDARIDEEIESSYASFRFVGGSTGIEQRSRRAALIERLLEAHGFETDCRADLVNARLRRRPAAEMEKALVTVGLVIGYANHLDMALTSNAEAKRYAAAFLEGRYDYKGGDDGR